MSSNNYLQQFGDFKALTIIDFMKIWNHYDRDHSGHLECVDQADGSNEFRDFVNDYMMAGLGGKSDAANLESTIDHLMAEYDRNHNHMFELNELLEMLPVEANFLEKFKTVKYSKKDFDDIFLHYDQDNSGKLQGEEIDGFIRDLLARDGKIVDAIELSQMKSQVLLVADLDHDGLLDRNEVEVFLGSRKN